MKIRRFPQPSGDHIRLSICLLMEFQSQAHLEKTDPVLPSHLRPEKKVIISVMMYVANKGDGIYT